MKLFSDKHFKTALITILCFVGVLCGIFSLSSSERNSRNTAGTILYGTISETGSAAPSSVEISWTSGNIFVVSSESISEISMKQTDEITGKTSDVQYSSSDDALYITEEAENKILELFLPADMHLEYLSIDCNDGNITLNNVDASEIIIEAKNACLYFNDTKCDQLTANVKNGNILFNDAVSSVALCTVAKGNIEGSISASQYYFETTAGNVTVSSESELERIDVAVTTGNIDLTLAECDGMDIQAKTSVGSINVDIPTTFNGDSYIYKDGSVHVTLNTDTGNVHVRLQTDNNANQKTVL